MDNHELSEGGLFERSSVTRVAIVSEFICNGKKYLLLINNASRGEWEIPGGTLLPEEDPIAAARREFAEEVGVQAGETSFQEIPVNQLSTSTKLDLSLGPGAETRQGRRIISRLVLASTQIQELPQNLPLSTEHTDFMFLEIPREWGETQRKDYLSMLRQFRSQKLDISNKSSNKIRHLKLTDNSSEIEHRKRNLSTISGIALTAYIEAWFNDLI